MQNNNSTNEIIKSISGILAVTLPIIQLFFTYLPENINKIFINKESFFFTSLFTLLFSAFIFFAYKSKPYFRMIINTKQQQKYLTYLSRKKQPSSTTEENTEQEIVLPPFEITAEKVAIFCIIFAMVAGFAFIRIGTTKTGPNRSFIQSVLYILTFTCAVFIFTHYSRVASQFAMWKKNKAERIQKAINLAIENKGFEEFPKINFLYQFEDKTKFPTQLVVGIKVQGKKYHIFTDTNAEELYQVFVIQEAKS